jgi:hypothetical protein
VRTDGIVIQALNDYIADFSTLEGTWDERVEASAVAALRLMNVWQGCPEFLDFTLMSEDR